MWFRFFCLILASWLFLTPPGQAETPRDLVWDDLVPKALDFDDPLQALSDTQKAKVSFVLRARALQKKINLPDDSELVRLAEKQVDELARDGVDIEVLIDRTKALRDVRRRRNESVVTGLDGKMVRLAGYVVPLEFDSTTVTEFLLVPFAGACVHVPPPPPNQIVHVRLDNGFKNIGLFTPVRVAGRLSAKGFNRSVYLTDGTLDIDVAYSLRGNSVQPWDD